jgi:hypothetical protein
MLLMKLKSDKLSHEAFSSVQYQKACLFECVSVCHGLAPNWFWGRIGSPIFRFVLYVAKSYSKIFRRGLVRGNMRLFNPRVIGYPISIPFRNISGRHRTSNAIPLCQLTSKLQQYNAMSDGLHSLRYHVTLECFS